MTELVHVVETHQTPEPALKTTAEPAPAPARRRVRLSGLLGTLGARLVAGVVVLVFLVVASAGTATYYALNRNLQHRLLAQLTQTAQSPQIQHALETRFGPYGQMGPSPQQVWLVVLKPDGTLFARQTAGGATVLMNLSQAERTRLAHGAGQHRNLRTTDGAGLLVQATSGYVEDGATNTRTAITYVVGLSTNEIDQTMNTVAKLEAGIGGAAVLLTLLISAWGVNVGLGPLKRVTRTAQEVTAEMSADGGGLDRRVPQTASTTEVGQLATSFNSMLDQFQREFTARRESEERMRQFLADASHELRTPLTSIRGYAELARLQRGRAGATALGTASAGGADDDSIGRIETEGTRMSRLVEDLLLLARGDDAGAEAQRNPVDLGQEARQALDDVRMAHPQRDITASLAPDLVVAGDSDQLLRVLRNLIGNAAIHTDPGAAIRVTGRRDRDSVIIQVADGGPGLPPEDAAHVFERFWRADKARTRVRGGSGLGLSIVAQIVAAHGGYVVFDSSVADGSTVTVTLPALAGLPAAGGATALG